MKITLIDGPLPYAYLEDIYTEEELNNIYQELIYLQPKLLDPSQTSSAKINGSYIKNNSGVFLDVVYGVREFSYILTHNRKLFSKECIRQVSRVHPSYATFNSLNRDETLVSYYEDGGYYGPHRDLASITILNWIHLNPKNFTGGEFIFSEYNIKIEPKNNTGVIFLSCYEHCVNPVLIINKDIPYSGRFTLSSFCTFLPIYDN